MKHDDTLPPHSMRSVPPAIKPTVESRAMKNLFGDVRRRMLTGESVAIIVPPGNGLELLRFAERAISDDHPPIYVVDRQPLTDDDPPPDIPNNDLLVVRGDNLPASAWNAVESFLMRQRELNGDTGLTTRSALLAFPDRGSLKEFSARHSCRTTRNWKNPLFWPPMSERNIDRRGLIYKMMETLTYASNKQMRLAAETRRYLQNTPYETVLHLYQQVSTGFRHALQQSAEVVTIEHIFGTVEKSLQTPPQT